LNISARASPWVHRSPLFVDPDAANIGMGFPGVATVQSESCPEISQLSGRELLSSGIAAQLRRDRHFLYMKMTLG
jgi:hypothetical protein